MSYVASFILTACFLVTHFLLFHVPRVSLHQRFFFVKENKVGVIQLANTRHTWSNLSTLYFFQVTHMFSFSSFLKEKGKLATEVKLVSCQWNFFENALTAVLCHVCCFISVYFFVKENKRRYLALRHKRHFHVVLVSTFCVSRGLPQNTLNKCQPILAFCHALTF